jgi:hypothetical protein
MPPALAKPITTTIITEPKISLMLSGNSSSIKQFPYLPNTTQLTVLQLAQMKSRTVRIQFARLPRGVQLEGAADRQEAKEEKENGRGFHFYFLEFFIKY